MNVRPAILGLALALFAAPASAADVKIGDLTISAPYARATPKGAEVGSAYFTLRNDGGAPEVLVSVTVDFAAPELHQMSDKGGVMNMAELTDGLAIPAHGGVTLAPGGIHLMLTKLAHPLVKGEAFKARLHFAHAGDVEVEFPVGGFGASAPP